MQQAEHTAEYAGGHPNIDKPQKVKVVVRESDKRIEIQEAGIFARGGVLGTIPGDQVKNIPIEDKSTVSRRTTVGRMLLVGVFAFAWKKKKKDSEHFVIIEWNDGRFDHETLFEFEGKRSAAEATAFRNFLINAIK